LHGSWGDIGAQFGRSDAVYLPINGFRFSVRNLDVDTPASMTPEQAADTALVLGARVIVPIHYGLSASFHREEPDAPQRLRPGRLQSRLWNREIGDPRSFAAEVHSSPDLVDRARVGKAQGSHPQTTTRSY